MTIKKLIAAAVLAVALAGCAPAPTSGTVIDKDDRYVLVGKVLVKVHYLYLDSDERVKVKRDVYRSCDIGDRWDREVGCP